MSNFKTQAEVPFKWESQPGKPKDPPKDTEFHHLALVDLQPQAAVEARCVHAPPAGVAPKMAGGGRFRKLTRLRQKKVVNKHVETAGPEFSSRATGLAAAHGLHGYSNNGPKLDRDLDDHHLICSNASSSPKSFCSSSSVGSASSSASNNTSYNVALKRRSKLRNLAWGCIKWVS